MINIPTTEHPLIIRTDFSTQASWDDLTDEVQEPADPFVFNMEFLDDRANEGATVKQLMAALPEDYPHSFLVVADKLANTQPDHPLLVVDLLEEPGNKFRAIATQVAAIENNLSTANMGFDEFAEAVDETGVFRGLPES
ncbi:MAG: hypothetical protein JWR26_4197 [Pedosphaera sp.]|nr:hypothetical protein [Pedosphaera sp.]